MTREEISFFRIYCHQVEEHTRKRRDGRASYIFFPQKAEEIRIFFLTYKSAWEPAHNSIHQGFTLRVH